MKRLYQRPILIYFACILLTLVLFAFSFRIWESKFLLPLDYRLDTLNSLTAIKQQVTQDSIYNNINIGAPYGASYYNRVNTDGLFYLIIKLLSLFIKQPTILINVFFLLTFVLTSILTLYVFLEFRIRHLLAILGSIIFSFLPYHLLRGERHLFLSAYFMIPVFVGLLLKIVSNEVHLDKSLKNKPLLIGSLIALLIASSGIYYAFFAVFFLLVTILVCIIQNQNKTTILTGVFFLFVVFLGIFINLLPIIISSKQNGKTPAAVTRQASDAETYSLKFIRLFLPLKSYRIKPLSVIKEKVETMYSSSADEKTEYLGLIGSLGFGILTLVILGYRPKLKQMDLLKNLAIFNLIGLFLSISSGLGLLIALTVLPPIRAYDRISPFIAFFCLFAFLLICQQFINSAKTSKIKIFRYLIILALFVIGLSDQIIWYRPNYDTIRKEFESDASFVNQIERQVPAKSMIFQLPYKQFPETGPIDRLYDYDLFKGYYHSNTLRFSYGVMKETEGDLRNISVVSLPVEHMVKTMAALDYSGIYIDRFGYQDNGQSLEKDLSKIINVKPIVSNDQRLSFFPLIKYNAVLKSRLKQKQSQKETDLLISPLILKWQSGFSNFEQNGVENWRWCGETGTLTILNNTQNTIKSKIRMSIASANEEYSDLQIKSSSFNETLKINSKPSPYAKDIVIAPGTYTLNFYTNAKRIAVVNDPRIINFRVINFTIDNEILYTDGI